MNETIQQIKSHINPLRVLKVADFESIAELIWEDKQPRIEGVLSRRQGIRIIAYQLISSFESLTSQPLTKEIVLEWFEGFEESNKNSLKSKDGHYFLWYSTENTKDTFEILDETSVLIRIKNPTVSDLIYHISKFNETASKPVEINVTDSFIQELIK